MDKTDQSKILEKSISKCAYGTCDGSGINFSIDENMARICRCYEDRVVNNRLDFANIPEVFKDLTINSFEVDLYSTEENRQKALIAKRKAANFIKNFDIFQEEGKGLYLYSRVKGSGKTRMAVSIGNALMKVKRLGVKYTTTMDLLGEIKSTFSPDSRISESDLIKSIKNISILILDDVGVENPTPWVRSIFYSILDGRMNNNKITIFTSNLSMDELDYEERLKSRIEKMAIPIEFPEESIRGQIARKENEELQRLLLQ